MPHQSDRNINYMVTSEEDELWGLTVTTLGQQKIDENEVYPPKSHPTVYYFNCNS